MRFTKMHGLGNDYVYVDVFHERVADPAGLAPLVSDRFTGIGADGLILIAPSRVADCRMEMYNADGSRGRMCGNGIRCVAKYVVEHGLAAGHELRIETDSGVREAICHLEGGKVSSVRVDMGAPSLAPGDLPCTLPVDRLVDHPLTLGDATYRTTCVSLGNPHAVVFVDDLATLDLARVGPLFEHAPIFPERINLHVVRVDSSNELTMATWERGSGITRACGTGACAVCVAGVVSGRSDRRVTVHLPGGDLLIEWSSEGRVWKTGPAVEVFTGTWLGPLSSRA
jgi:diaminopimelate epimerase